MKNNDAKTANVKFISLYTEREMNIKRSRDKDYLSEEMSNTLKDKRMKSSTQRELN